MGAGRTEVLKEAFEERSGKAWSVPWKYQNPVVPGQGIWLGSLEWEMRVSTLTCGRWGVVEAVFCLGVCSSLERLDVILYQAFCTDR